jgi:hypothetical protein
MAEQIAIPRQADALATTRTFEDFHRAEAQTLFRRL